MLAIHRWVAKKGREKGSLVMGVGNVSGAGVAE